MPAVQSVSPWLPRGPALPQRFNAGSAEPEAGLSDVNGRPFGTTYDWTDL